MLQALWVLGSAATLQRSPVWAALLEDAEKRTKIVPDAFAKYAVLISSDDLSSSMQDRTMGFPLPV